MHFTNHQNQFRITQESYGHRERPLHPSAVRGYDVADEPLHLQLRDHVRHHLGDVPLVDPLHPRVAEEDLLPRHLVVDGVHLGAVSDAAVIQIKKR